MKCSQVDGDRVHIVERSAVPASMGMVKSHISRIYEKRHVKSMAGAVSLAVREGLV